MVERENQILRTENHCNKVQLGEPVYVQACGWRVADWSRDNSKASCGQQVRHTATPELSAWLAGCSQWLEDTLQGRVSSPSKYLLLSQPQGGTSWLIHFSQIHEGLCFLGLLRILACFLGEGFVLEFPTLLKSLPPPGMFQPGGNCFRHPLTFTHSSP